MPTIMVSKDDISNPLHPNLWEDWMQELGLNPDQDMVELELSGSSTSRKDRAEAGGNKSCIILHHTISYYFRDTDLLINDSGLEHIAYMIGQDCSEGELSEQSIDGGEIDVDYCGHWRIQE